MGQAPSCDENYVARDVVNTDYVSKTEHDASELQAANLRQQLEDASDVCDQLCASEKQVLQAKYNNCSQENQELMADMANTVVVTSASFLSETDLLRKTDGNCPPTANCCATAAQGTDQTNCPAGIQNGFVQDGIKYTYNNPSLCDGTIAVCGNVVDTG